MQVENYYRSIWCEIWHLKAYKNDSKNQEIYYLVIYVKNTISIKQLDYRQDLKLMDEPCLPA